MATPDTDLGTPSDMDSPVLMAQNAPPPFPKPQAQTQPPAIGPNDAIPFDDGDTDPKSTGYRNQAALSRYPPDVQSKARMLASYSIPYPQFQLGREAQKGGGAWTLALQAASELDPAFDAKQYPARESLMKKFTSMAGADNKTAFNTAISHLDSLAESQKALKNFSSPLLNAPVNAFESGVLGDPRQGNVSAKAAAVADELTRAFRGTSGAEQEVQDWKKTVGGVNQSPDQQKGIRDTAVQLLAGRLRQLRQQYVDGMGRPPEWSFLTPDSRKILQKLGYNPDEVEAGKFGAAGGLGTAAGAALTIDGVPHTFPDQRAADAAKAELLKAGHRVQ